MRRGFPIVVLRQRPFGEKIIFSSKKNGFLSTYFINFSNFFPLFFLHFILHFFSRFFSYFFVFFRIFSFFSIQAFFPALIESTSGQHQCPCNFVVSIPKSNDIHNLLGFCIDTMSIVLSMNDTDVYLGSWQAFSRGRPSRFSYSIFYPTSRHLLSSFPPTKHIYIVLERGPFSLIHKFLVPGYLYE